MLDFNYPLGFRDDDSGTAEHGYEATSNPLYIWVNIEAWLNGERPFPPWAMDYLKRCAKGILDADPKKTGKKRLDNGDLKRAIEIEARHFKEMEPLARSFAIKADVETLAEESKTLEEAFELVAPRYGLGPERMRQIYYDLKRAMKDAS